MAEIPLSEAQETFLEECALEFSDRFTDADLDFKKIYDAGIPKPPIMYPWFGRGRFNHWERDRDRGGGRRFDREHRGEHHDNNYRNRERNRDYGRNSQQERRYKPY